MTSTIEQYIRKRAQLGNKCECELSLVDFQWRFAVSSLHSSMPNNSSTFIQLKLILSDPCQQQKKRVQHIEMDIAEFKKFYKEMQTISSMLSIMK